jgi:Helix-turn-helix domain
MIPEKGTGPDPVDRGPDIPSVANDDHTPLLFAWQRALRDSGLPAATRLVGLVLSTYMNMQGGSAFPGASRLANDTGLCVRTVKKHLGRLVRTGWLVIVERGGLKGEKRRANRYQATFPDGTSHGSSTRAGDAPVPVQEIPPTSAGDAPQHLIEQLIGTSHLTNENSKPKSERDKSGGAFTSERDESSRNEEETEDDERLGGTFSLGGEHVLEHEDSGDTDALKARAVAVLVDGRGEYARASRRDVIAAVDELRAMGSHGMSDSVIDEALGSIEKELRRDPKKLVFVGYFLKAAVEQYRYCTRQDIGGAA